MKIKYKKAVNYRGKNSGYKQMGLMLFEYEDIIRFTPIHSKDGLGDGYLEIPKENIQELIDLLKTLK